MPVERPPILYDAPMHVVSLKFPDPESHRGEGHWRDVIEEHPEIMPSRAVSVDLGPGTVVGVREPEPIHEGMGLGAWRMPRYLFRPDSGRPEEWCSGEMLRPESGPITSGRVLTRHGSGTVVGPAKPPWPPGSLRVAVDDVVTVCADGSMQHSGGIERNYTQGELSRA